jgi:hypothetical protein
VSISPVHAQANKSALYVIEGVVNTGTLFGGNSFTPNPNEILETKVQSHTDQAEFGQVLAGTVNVVTKSGTNEFHGAVCEYPAE